jgi:hypothetical protein
MPASLRKGGVRDYLGTPFAFPSEPTFWLRRNPHRKQWPAERRHKLATASFIIHDVDCQAERGFSRRGLFSTVRTPHRGYGLCKIGHVKPARAEPESPGELEGLTLGSGGPKVRLRFGAATFPPTYGSAVAAGHVAQDLGNLSRNSFRGPGFFATLPKAHELDASIYKVVRAFERLRFAFGASAYNLLNHTNLADPYADVSSPGPGLI